MINKESLNVLKKERFSTRFKRPVYDSFAFARIPETVLHLLTKKSKQPLPISCVGRTWEKYDLVILFFIDGFGWEFFEGYAHKYPFLQRFIDEGIASQLSSQFPSTTAAHVTTVNTGIEVGQTGIYEWFYYEPKVDRMIAPLLFSYAGDHESNTLIPSGITPQELYPFKTIYQQLEEKDVRTIAMQQEWIAHSPYSQAMLAGAENRPYQTFPQALDALVDLCHEPAGKPTYTFIYFGDIDAMGHRHGIPSPQFADAAEYCWKNLEERFWQRLGACNKKIAVIITADHGMVPVNPKTTLFLNKAIPDITTSFKTNKKGLPLVPAGSPRDFFLHVKEEQLETMLKQLRKLLKGVAEVYPTSELLEAGFFGQKPPSQRLRERIGNLVILPYLGESVWWWQKHHFEQHFFAAHGGLTPDEMETIFLFNTLC